MSSYILRRIMIGILVAFAVVTAVFFSLHIAPGDPVNMLIPPDAGSGVGEDIANQIREKYGLNKPLYIQYFMYLNRLVHLNFGESMVTGRDVSGALIRRYPATIELALASLAIACLIGIPAGVISAVYQNTIIDSFSRIFALLGVSLPNFWLGLMLVLFFSLQLGWLPSLGKGGPIWTIRGLKHLILPAITLGTASASLIMRLTRSSMLDILLEDYITTARAKGLKERVVIYIHALRNALIPVVTVLGLQFGLLLGGSVVIETVFSWPGIGRYAVQAITSKNFPAVQGSVIFISLGFLIVNLIVDLFYCFLDPRIVYD